MAQDTCSVCAVVLPAGARFCPSCGAANGSRRGDERRVVTVLFADVVGFTPFSEDRDPEHVKNLLDRCFDRLATEIGSHGGRVDKIVGDEIMAVFGAPVAHEDDPERAVRAALQMQRNLAEHASETGADVRMRIGVNTGEVLVGALRAGGDVTALGDVVNIAKRLQTAAQPGQVVVGNDTYQPTRDAISYEEIGALTVKGRGAPVGAWRAVQALGPPGSRRGRQGTPLVGRMAEKSLIRHALDTAVRHNRPHFVLLTGDAGMGKTMLVEEAIRTAHVQHEAFVMEGRCLPYGEANPWWPIAEALRQACRIDPEDPADIATDKCRKAIAAVMGDKRNETEATRIADGLLYLMGYDSPLSEVEPTRARDEVIRAIQMSIAANAKIRPLLIVLSEIHWADQLILDLIDSMFDRLRGLPVVLVATARPDLEERWAPRPGRHNLFVVNLNPLERSETAELVGSLIESEPSEDLINLVYDRSGGNPLFVTELLAVMDETGLAALGEAREGELPATLRGLVSARLDALDTGDRSVLEDASVVGRSGPIAALAELGESRGEAGAKARIAGLVHKDFLAQMGTDYEFKSDLVREVAYETLTKGERAKRHAAIAEWLENYAKRTEREEEYLERIAHHYAQATALVRDVGNINGVPSDVLERAMQWLDRAAARAEEREISGVSVHLLDHALELVPNDRPDIRSRFLLARARGRAGQRNMDGARADADAVLEIAHENTDTALRARALTVRGEIDQKDAAYDASAMTLQEAVRLWREIDDKQGEAEALRLWGFTSMYKGENSAAEAAITDALAISRDIGDRRGEAWALQNLAWAAFSRGDNDAAEERLVASAKVFEEVGDVGGRAWALGLLGYVWFFKGRLDDAAKVAEGSVDFSRELGDRWAHGMMLNLLSSVRMWQGRTRESLEHARHAHQLFTLIDDKMGLVFASMGVAWGSVLTGEPEDGLAMALEYMPAASMVFAGGWAGVLAASTLHALVGDTATAIKILDEYDLNEPDLLAARALSHFVAGDPTAAFEFASKSWASGPTEQGEKANLGCIYALAAAAAGHPEDALTVADEVIKVGGTYLDRLRAHLARTFAYAQLGKTADVETALQDAHRIVDSTDDDLHKALVVLAECTTAAVLGDENAPVAARINSARDRLEQLGVAWRPWERAFRGAATGGRTEAAVGPVAD